MLEKKYLTEIEKEFKSGILGEKSNLNTDVVVHGIQHLNKKELMCLAQSIFKVVLRKNAMELKLNNLSPMIVANIALPYQPKKRKKDNI